MKTFRVTSTGTTEFEDSRVRPAIKNPGRWCYEMHCNAVALEHKMGTNGCSWVELEDGSMISRTEARETSTRPDRMK